MFETMMYEVASLDGDYAYLKNLSMPDTSLKCVARALLPEAIREGSVLKYEMLEYELIEN